MKMEQKERKCKTGKWKWKRKRKCAGAKKFPGKSPWETGKRERAKIHVNSTAQSARGKYALFHFSSIPHLLHQILAFRTRIRRKLRKNRYIITTSACYKIGEEIGEIGDMCVCDLCDMRDMCV